MSRPRLYPPDVAKARRLEIAARQRTIHRLLAECYEKRRPGQYAADLATIQAQLDSERGPLPGD